MSDRHHFRKICQALAMSAVLVALIGCATGQDFVKAEPGDFKLQKSTRSEVFQRMGSHPSSLGSIYIDGKMIKTMAYSYQLLGPDVGGMGRQLKKSVTYANAQAGDPDPDAMGARSQVFYFLNGVLVGMDYASSFEVDATKFNPDRIAQIKKGQSTKSDVIRLLGPGDGLYAPPLIPASAYRGLVYIYTPTSDIQHASSRKLVIIYDRKGVVTDLKYSEQGQNWVQY